MSEPYVKHIGKRRAYPAECPICGQTSNADYDLPYEPNDMRRLMIALYDYPSHLFVQEPTYGYKTWYYVCYHTKPYNWIADTWLKNPFVKMVSKDFDGAYYPLPLVLSECK